MQFRIAVDAGGTFTDGVLMSATGEALTAKAQTTPRDPTLGTMNCISKLAEAVGLGLRQMLEQTSTIVHGTTLATNVVATRSGAKLGTIATRGYRVRMSFPQVAKSDWLEQRRDMYDFHYDAPQPLTRNYLMTEVSERVNTRGEVLVPLDEEDVRKAVRYLKGHNVEAIAVMLIHSALYPEHELRVAQIVREEYPSVYVYASCVVLPVVGEVARWSTTMFSAYVAPAITGYVEKIRSVLKREGFGAGELLFVQSNGGTATPDVVIANPATLLLSGPAAGPSLGLSLGTAHDFRNVLSVDMGGTSFDVGVVHDGMVDVVQQKVIDAMKYALPSVDVSAAGAGGGSIASIDASGRLQVGPKSAGALPGPACYDRGGENPTVTDANVVLGYLDPGYFLGGEVRLNKASAERSIKKKIADPLGLSVVEAAAAIYNIINARMAGATGVTFVKRGYDPRDFMLCAAGGAAAIHAVSIMEELGIASLIIPKVAPIYCAYAMLFCDFKHDYQRAYWVQTAKADLERIRELYAEMEREALRTLAREGIAEADVSVERTMEVRYYGQFRQRTARVPPGPIDQAALEAAIENFHQVHRSTVGYADPAYPTEIVRLHLSGIGRLPKPGIAQPAGRAAGSSMRLKGTRKAWFHSHGMLDTQVIDADTLSPGDTLQGPCIVEERFTTVVLPPHARCRIDGGGNYVVTTNQAGG